MAHMMYSQHHATMAPPQKPETFMLSSEAQQSLPQDAQVALQQVDNRKPTPNNQYQDAMLNNNQ
jgi:transcription factor STE12